MIKTPELVEFLQHVDVEDNGDIEYLQIIIHRLRYLDQLKEEVSNSYSGIVASELFEKNDL